jgi:hypothetical protein
MTLDFALFPALTLNARARRVLQMIENAYPIAVNRLRLAVVATGHARGNFLGKATSHVDEGNRFLSASI